MPRAWRWQPMSPGTGAACAEAGAFGLACAWLLLDVATTQRGLGQLIAPGIGDWLPFCAAGAAGVLLAARAGEGPRARLRVAVCAAAALGLAAAMPLVSAGRGGELRLLLQTLGLGLVLGCHSLGPHEGREAPVPGWRARLAVVGVAASRRRSRSRARSHGPGSRRGSGPSRPGSDRC